MITKNIDEGKPTDAVYLDFAKAFDKVSTYKKEHLFKKLKSHGSGQDVIRWIRSWLTDRKHRVVLNGQWCARSNTVPHL